MLNLVIADAELELIPKEMLDDYAIRKHAKKRGKPASAIILDSNFMHTSIERYFPGESTRRGRPDIIFVLLQVAMESILNKKGQLRVFIHTRNDLVIDINPVIRMPRSYNRFVGLMENLFDKKEIKTNDEVLLSINESSVEGLIDKINFDRLVILSPKGERKKLDEIVDKVEDYLVVIGGFSEGDFRSDVYSLGESYSIFEEELTIWSVASEIIAEYERMLT